MIGEKIKIRVIESNDINKLQEIGKVTFAETFVNDCAPSDMEKYLEEKHNQELLKSELENPESQFFFALMDGHIIGYLKINSGNAQTEFKLENAMEIERLYVLSPFQGMQVGQLLMNTALKSAKNSSFKWVWLGVWEHNAKAIQFYKKNGFALFDSHPFSIGKEIQTDVLMKLELFPGNKM